jgi:hypothetical protein
VVVDGVVVVVVLVEVGGVVSVGLVVVGRHGWRCRHHHQEPRSLFLLCATGSGLPFHEPWP